MPEKNVIIQRIDAEIEFIRSSLMKYISWSPFDYIPGISLERDRQVLVDGLTEDIPAEDDLRIVYQSTQNDLIGVFARRLPWDSDFFGSNIARLDGVYTLNRQADPLTDDYNSAIRLWLKFAEEHNIKYIFGQIDPRDIALLRSLGDLGFSVIESRVFYYLIVKDYSYPERFGIRSATAEDVPLLARVAREMVNPYDRFHADPFIGTANADRLMERWVQASVLEGFADITLVPDVPNPMAFCTVKYHRKKWDDWGVRLSQPILSAVSPNYKGWYRRLISEVNYHLKDFGAEYVFFSTQVTNRAVIHVWESLGIRFGKASLVLRKIL